MSSIRTNLYVQTHLILFSVQAMMRRKATALDTDRAIPNHVTDVFVQGMKRYFDIDVLDTPSPAASSISHPSTKSVPIVVTGTLLDTKADDPKMSVLSTMERNVRTQLNSTTSVSSCRAVLMHGVRSDERSTSRGTYLCLGAWSEEVLDLYERTVAELLRSLRTRVIALSRPAYDTDTNISTVEYIVNQVLSLAQKMKRELAIQAGLWKRQILRNHGTVALTDILGNERYSLENSLSGPDCHRKDSVTVTATENENCVLLGTNLHCSTQEAHRYIYQQKVVDEAVENLIRRLL